MSLPMNLDVPMEYQEDDFSCVPVCIKMVLEYVRKHYSSGFIPNLNIKEISEAIETDELGTALENVKKINEKLVKAVPSIEFVAELNCNFAEIEHEIFNNRPVIAWIKIPFCHSVVITGLNKESLIIYYNDPQRGKECMNLGKFMSAWREIDNVLIKVKIGEKVQRILPEYTGKSE
ncbi:MAG: cysteine peptidase family C39 domain-containing protein [Candidatus Bathyarchaeia archaeon]|jgi:ABC-type bacteriocin/lantibiotic exporter with double-glycine peptidase domain